MEQWEKELQDLDTKNNSKKQNYKNTIILICVAIFLFPCMILSNYKWKKSVPPTQVTKKSSNELKQIKELNSKIENLQADLVITKNRLVLLGIVHNENISLIRRKGDMDKFIFVDREWKINLTPENVQLEEDQVEFLKDKVN